MRTHILAFKRLGLMDGVQVQTQTGLVVVVHHPFTSRRQPFDDVTGHAVLHKRSPGLDSNRGAAGEQNLLKCEGAVVVVGQIGAI